MGEERGTLGNNQWLNFQEYLAIFSLYRIPVFLFFLGIIFFIAAIFLFIKNAPFSQQVVFHSEASVSGQKKIRIDIAGAVMKPGVYEFNEEERVIDALAAAGGLAAEADREWIEKNLNRAAKLVDGGKIYIPHLKDSTSGKFQTSSPDFQTGISYSSSIPDSGLLGVSLGKININTASSAELESLPGIGPVTAKKIIANRPYQSVEELKNRKIIGHALYEKVKNLLTIY